MKSIDTEVIDAEWPEAVPLWSPTKKVSQAVLEELCAPLVKLARERKERRGATPCAAEIHARSFVLSVLEGLGLESVVGPGWKVTCVPTRFRQVGDELIPIADAGLRVTIAKVRARFQVEHEVSAVIH